MNKKRKKFYDWFCTIDLIVCTNHYELHNNHKDPNPEALVRIETFKARSGKKACKMCGRRLPLSAFGRSKCTPDGFRLYCRECADKSAEARKLKRN